MGLQVRPLSLRLRLASEFWFTKKTKVKTHEKERVLHVGDLFPL